MSGLRTPLGRARGLGSAKDGVHHWWMQRLTAIALALLTPWFLWLVLMHGQDFGSIRDAVSQPLNANLLIAFVIALFWHARLGLQVVIEDYVHTRSVELALQVIVTFACALGALAAVVAILRITLFVWVTE